MAFDDSPTTWLGAGYNQTGDTIVINTNDAASNKTLTELTNAYADETTGDVRKLFYALTAAMYAAQQAQAEADRPTRMTITRRSAADADGNLIFQFGLNFTLSATGLAIAAE